MKPNYSFNSPITYNILRKNPIVSSSCENSFRSKPYFSESYNILKTGKQLSKIHRKLFSSKPRFKKLKNFNSKGVGDGLVSDSKPSEHNHIAITEEKKHNIFSDKKERSITVKLMELKIKEVSEFSRKKILKISPLYINQSFRNKPRFLPLFKVLDQHPKIY